MPASTSDLVYRVAGTVVGVGLAAATALWEAMLTTLYVTDGGTVIRLPVAPVLAVLTNVGLVVFITRVTERPMLAVLTGVVWSGLIFTAGAVTSEGDLLILGNWVGILTTFLGSFAWIVALFVVITKRNLRAQAAAPVAPTRPARPANR